MRLRLAAALALTAMPAFGQAPESRYTELVGGRCKFVSEDRETGEDAVKR